MKTIKILFLDGSFKIFYEVLEFSSAKIFFFLVQRENGANFKARAFKRENIEEIYRRNRSGKYIPVKLTKSLIEERK